VTPTVVSGRSEEEDDMSDMDDLLKQVNRLGVPGHVHRSPGSDEACPPGEICIREAETFIARIGAPDRKSAVHVDSMTAWGVLDDLPDDAGLEALWAELVDIDQGA
jgi:hypothetical protein